MRYYTRFVLIISLVSFFSSGCAVQHGYMIQPEKIGYDNIVSIGGAEYVSLSQFCRSYGSEYFVDNISKVAEIRYGKYSVKIMPDSNISLINGSVRRFSPEATVKNNELYIPLSLAGYIEKEIFKYERRAVIPTVKGVTIKRIVIDPGHGGKDPGAVGRNGLREKDVVLDIAKRLKDELRKKENFDIVMTRTNDEFISLHRRSEIANQANADLFISVHANASRSRNVKGFEVYYLSNATDDTARAIAAVENQALSFENNSYNNENPTVWDMKLQEFRNESKELAAIICNKASSRLCVENRGIKSARFYVLKGARMPSVLIEVGFISNKEEESNLLSSSYRQQVAQAIAEGVLMYKKKFEKTEGFTKGIE